MPRRRPAARLFAALALPQALARQLSQWARSFLARPGVRLIAADHLHLTLSFLAERPVAEIDALCAAVEGFEAEPPLLAIGAPTFLPRRRPRTVAVEIIDLDGTLTALQSALAGALAAASTWEPASRGFHPHVTVARMHSGTPLAPAPATPDVEFRPVALELLRSHLEPTGAVYETLARRPFDLR